MIHGSDRIGRWATMWPTYSDEEIRLVSSGVCYIDKKFFFRLLVYARVLMHGFHLTEINSWACTPAYTVSVSVCVSPGQGGRLGQKSL